MVKADRDMNSSQMKICHVLTSLGFGGVETRMRVIARTIPPARRQQVVFVAIGSGGAAEQELRDLGYTVYCLGAKTSVYSVTTLFAVLRALRKIRPDVVHAHGAEANLHAVVASWLLGVRVRVAEEIGITTHSRLGRTIFRLTYGMASRVIAISRVVAASLERQREVRAPKLIVIENPVREITLADTGERPAHLRMAYVGRLVDWKEVVNVICAMEKVKQNGHTLEFWIIGDGPERKSLEKMVSALALQDCVSFFGFQTRPERLLSACDLFVLPSNEKEGYCMALVEAMAASVPPVSTRVGIAPEVIEHGRTGWLIAPRDIDALSEALLGVSALGRPKLIEIGRAARDSILRRGSPERYVEELDSLYADLLSKRNVVINC